MKRYPLFDFFIKKRNYILKEGPIGIHKKVSINITGTLNLSGDLSIKIIRSKPWYRRSLKIIWSDLRYKIMESIHKWINNLKARQQHQKVLKQSKVKVTENFFFDYPKWRNRSACDLIQEYLKKLEKIIDEAEVRFQNKSSKRILHKQI